MRNCNPKMTKVSLPACGGFPSDGAGGRSDREVDVRDLPVILDWKSFAVCGRALSTGIRGMLGATGALDGRHLPAAGSGGTSKSLASSPSSLGGADTSWDRSAGGLNGFLLRERQRRQLLHSTFIFRILLICVQR